MEMVIDNRSKDRLLNDEDAEDEDNERDDKNVTLLEGVVW